MLLYLEHCWMVSLKLTSLGPCCLFILGWRPRSAQTHTRQTGLSVRNMVLLNACQWSACSQAGPAISQTCPTLHLHGLSLGVMEQLAVRGCGDAGMLQAGYHEINCLHSVSPVKPLFGVSNPKQHENINA